MVVPRLCLGQVHRTERVLMAAGGKGLNVARAAHSLGQPLRVCAPLGGATGQLVARLAAEEGFDCAWSWHEAGETRTCVLIVDPQGGDATVINEVGPTFQQSHWQAYVDVLMTSAAGADLITISGSLPPGIPASVLAELVQQLGAAGYRVIVDTSGQPLKAALDATPFGVKVNNTELGSALDRPITNVAEAAVALNDLYHQGIVLPVVTLGSQGALAASADGVCWSRPPVLNIVSTVGSGDSFLAGLATGLLRGHSLPESLRLGVSCGAADALTIGGGLVHEADREQIRGATTVVWL